MARLCQSLVIERRSELTGQRSDARLAEQGLERAVLDQPKSAAAWYGLGQIRLQLSRDTAFSRGGALMPVGASYLSGAGSAFIESLKLDGTFTRAADALVNVPDAREGGAPLKDRVAILRRVRATLPPRTLAGAASLEREAGNIDSAIAMERRALASGQVDVGLVSLGLARDLYRIHQSGEGRSVLIRGAASPTGETVRAYRGELSWVASPGELATWDSLAPATRSAWLADFWQKRDIAEGRKDGARLIEHYQRVEYALKTFPITLPQTGRQRTSNSLFGDDEAEARKLALKNADCFPELARLANDDELIGAHAVFAAYYKPVQNRIDDRGVIWIRRGRPSVRAIGTRGEAAEVWRYDRYPDPLVVQFRGVDFDGTVGASMLTPTLLTIEPQVRAQLCSAERRLCSGAERDMDIRALVRDVAFVPSQPGSCGVAFRGREATLALMASKLDMEAADPLLRTPRIIEARDRGREQIDLATTTDSYHRDFTHAIIPGVDIHGLVGDRGERPRLVVAFALPGEELTFTKAPGGESIYPVSIQVMASRLDGQRIDTDTLHNYRTPAPLLKGQFITDFIDMPVAAGTYRVSLIITQADGRGAVAHLAQVVVPASTSSLAVSDLVLGRENSGVRWNSGTTDVPLNPLNTYPRGGSAEVYFQLFGLKTGETYQTKFEFFRTTDDATHEPRLSVATAQVAPRDRLEVSRSLGLQNLEAGTYRVKLTVSGDGAETTATAWMTNHEVTARLGEVVAERAYVSQVQPSPVPGCPTLRDFPCDDPARCAP